MTLKRDNSPELLTKAEALFKAGQNAEARAEYMNVLEAHPGADRHQSRDRVHLRPRKGITPRRSNISTSRWLRTRTTDQLLQLAAASAMQVSDYPRAMAYLAKIDEATLDDPAILADAAVNLINKQPDGGCDTRSSTGSSRAFRTAPDAYFYRGFAQAEGQQERRGQSRTSRSSSSWRRRASPQVAQAKDLLAKIK